jgi:ankyrin repeat protein
MLKSLETIEWGGCESGNTPLVWAADSGRLGAVKYLLEVVGDEEVVNRKGYLGATAVCRAARKGEVRLEGREGGNDEGAKHGNTTQRAVL